MEILKDINIEEVENKKNNIIKRKKYIYGCNTCDFKTFNKTKAECHVLTLKHRKKMNKDYKEELNDIKGLEGLVELVKCDVCNKTVHKEQYNNHLNTKFHFKRANNVEKPSVFKKCTECNIDVYKYYWETHIKTKKHIKLCEKNNIVIPENNIIENNNIENTIN